MSTRGSLGVRDLLLSRRATRSTSGRRDDDATLALVCAGGGMRGVIAGGMVTALERLGFLDAFDILCGASSGAFAVAYFGAGQAALGTRIYSEDLEGSRFIVRSRLLRGYPMMDLDFLVDVVSVSVKPLDTAALLRRNAQILFVATDVVTGMSHVLKHFESGSEIREALRASARVHIAGPPVCIDEHAPLIDGALAIQFQLT